MGFQISHIYRAGLFVLVYLFFLLTSCGEEAEFSDNGAKIVQSNDSITSDTPEPTDVGQSADANPDNSDIDETPEGVVIIENPIQESMSSTALTWLWQCQTLEAEREENDPNTPLLEGSGNHPVSLHNELPLELTIEGNLCRPSDKERDIILIVDVSGSMRNNDPTDPVNGGCGRKTAAKNLIDSLKDSNVARMGLITFDNNVIVNSNNFLTPADFETAYLTDDVFCLNAGGTDFVNAFSGADAVLLNGRANSSKELFLITDGQPNDMALSKAKADETRANALIATIMLGDQDDSHLKNDIASKDSNGNPIHVIAKDAGDFGDT